MRIKPSGDDLPERVAIALNLAPLPAAFALYGLTAGRMIGVAQRVGIFAQLLRGAATAGRLAEELELQVAGLVFEIIQHLPGEQVAALLGRVRESLKPGGTVAILDMFRTDAKRQRASAAALGLLFHLTSGADLHSRSELAEYLRGAGFETPKRTRIRRIPDQDLYQARAGSGGG